MTDEEALFEVWWNLMRTERWMKQRPDVGAQAPSPEYMMGFKEHYWLGWQARASLHVTYDRSVPQHRTEQT